jgi:hypothetical protein
MGVTVVVASGNNGSGTQMNLPACVGNAISVGAVDAADAVADFSNSDVTTDVFAPGTNVEDITGIVSSWFGGGTRDVQGTSMAAPHVAGCAALLIESGDATTPNDIETRLETSTVQVTDPTNGLTFPRVDCGPELGSIVISKETEPALREGFRFAQDIEGDPMFQLDDNESRSFLDVLPGTYTVTELDPGTYIPLTELTCDDPSGGTVTDLGTRTAAIDLAPGETVTCVFTNTDLPPDVTVDPAAQIVQYSDVIQDIAVAAMDSDQDALSVTFSYSMDGGVFVPGLPAGLTWANHGCASESGVQTCTGTLGGIADVPEGAYVIRTVVTDDDGSVTVADVTVTTGPEDASVAFGSDNPVAVEVDTPGGDSPPFTLTVYVQETEPDEPAASAAPGDISLAVVSLALASVGPGGVVAGVCTPMGVTGSGYEQVLEVECSFENVPVNTYTVVATVGGGYFDGENEDVLTVFDPSLGFTTGGGWFYWPGTTERTNFGYTMKYNKKGANVRGSLLMIRHQPDGTKYLVKSNALYGLALGDGGTFDWASFSGEATYLEAGWPEPEGNHSFVAYVEDYGEPGKGMDRFWIQVMDKNGDVIGVTSMAREAFDNARMLEGGNIVVPHQGEKNNR